MLTHLFLLCLAALAAAYPGKHHSALSDEFLEQHEHTVVFHHDPESSESRQAMKTFSGVDLWADGIFSAINYKAETPRIEFFNYGTKIGQSLTRFKHMTNATLIEHVAKTRLHKGRSLSDQSKIKKYGAWLAHSDKKKHVILFLSPHASYTPRIAVDNFRQIVNGLEVDDDTERLTEFVFVPYSISTNRHFLESFAMVDTTSKDLHCKETKHVVVIIDNGDLLSRTKIGDLREMHSAISQV